MLWLASEHVYQKSTFHTKSILQNFQYKLFFQLCGRRKCRELGTSVLNVIVRLKFARKNCKCYNGPIFSHTHKTEQLRNNKAMNITI